MSRREGWEISRADLAPDVAWSLACELSFLLFFASVFLAFLHGSLPVRASLVRSRVALFVTEYAVYSAPLFFWQIVDFRPGAFPGVMGFFALYAPWRVGAEGLRVTGALAVAAPAHFLVGVFRPSDAMVENARHFCKGG